MSQGERTYSLRVSVTDILPKNCVEATVCTRRSGIYKILVTQHSNESFYVECDAETEGGGWIVAQSRKDGSIDFYRNWSDYEEGFGDLEGEHFIGLKTLYALTNFQGPQELLIVMGDNNNGRATAKYDGFSIGNETEMYKLKKLGMYSGTAGDSLTYHLGMKFSTKERDNDSDTGNCAQKYTGAWWYKSCHYSNLNGKYGDNTHAKGVNWHAFRGYTESLKYVKMMIRRRRINS
ncbi:hypothetical protein DOY81_013164 [Sarcophaga bullata]|nr:hypothetical protein DOY81_013164 [Sarcophaga bullata]